MKNIPDESYNYIKKNINILPNDNIKKTDKDNKQIILTESTQTQIKHEFKKKIFFSNSYKIIFIIFYFPIIILLETFYRDYLFQKSIPFQEKIHKDGKNNNILIFCKIISIFGGEISTLFLFGIIFLFMPLNYSFLLLQGTVYSSYLTNTLKMIYQSDRPNWHSDYLTFSCNYGYGNPSGHSLTSIVLYLSLSHILIHYYKIKGVIKIIIFNFFIIFSLLIVISRVILAVHSINQVIYGLTLGLGLYYLLIFILGYHKYSSFDFLQHIRKKKVYYSYYFIHLFLLIFAILIYIIIKPKDTTNIEDNIFNGIRCAIKNSYAKYKNDGLFQSLSITSIIGAQFGMNMLLKVLKKQNFMINVSMIEWNKSKDKKKIFLRIPIIFISSIGIILYYIVPEDFNLIFIFIFKSAIPFFLGMLGIHFIGIYMCIHLKIGNNDIYKMDVLHEITAN